MAYCTRTDIEVLVSSRTLQQLTDDAGDGVTNEEKLAAIIAQVDATIDGYLRGLYTVPLTTVPVEIMGLSRDLAIYELYTKRGIEEGVPEECRNRKKDAENRLRDIKRGDFTLDLTSPDARQILPILVDKTECDREFPEDLLNRI